MKEKTPYFIFTDPNQEKVLGSQSWYATFPFDDHRHYGVQNRKTKVVIVRNVNFVEALNLLDSINEGRRSGR